MQVAENANKKPVERNSVNNGNAGGVGGITKSMSSTLKLPKLFATRTAQFRERHHQFEMWGKYFLTFSPFNNDLDIIHQASFQHGSGPQCAHFDQQQLNAHRVRPNQRQLWQFAAHAGRLPAKPDGV